MCAHAQTQYGRAVSVWVCVCLQMNKIIRIRAREYFAYIFSTNDGALRSSPSNDIVAKNLICADGNVGNDGAIFPSRGFYAYTRL